MTTSGDDRRGSELSAWLAALGPPALVVGSLALWAASDTAGGLGPLDRAAVTWVVVAPLMLLGIGTSAILPSHVGTFVGYVSLLVEALAGAFFLAVALMAVTESVGCTPVIRGDQVVVPAITVGAAAGAALFLSGYAGAVVIGESRRSVIAGVATSLVAAAMLGGLVFLLWTVLFPVTLCAPTLPSS